MKVRLVEKELSPKLPIDPEHMYTLMASAKIGMWELDYAAGILTVDEQWMEITGHHESRLSETLELRRQETVHPEDVDGLVAKLREVYAGEADSFSEEYRFIRPDGRIVWLLEKGAVTGKDENGGLLYMSGFIQDISEIKQAEKLARDDSAMRAYVESLAGLAGWTWDLERDHVTFHNNHNYIYGLSPEDVNGPLKTLVKAIHPGDYAAMKKGSVEYLRRGEGIYKQEIRIRNPQTGKYVWLLDIYGISQRDDSGRPTQISGCILYIDDRVRAEQKLRKAMGRIEKHNETLSREVDRAVSQLKQSIRTNAAMFGANPQMNILFDRHRRVIDCNPAALVFFGFTGKDEFIQGFIPLIEKSLPKYQQNGEKSVSLADSLEEAFARGYSEFDSALNLGKQPKNFHVIFKRIPYGDAHAVVLFLNERSEAEERIRLMLDAMPVASFFIDEKYRVLDCNLEALRMFMASDKQSFLENFFRYSPEFQPDGTLSRRKAREMIRLGFEQGHQFFFWMHRQQNGEDLPCEITIRRVQWGGNYRLIICVRDLREIVKTEGEKRLRSRLLQTVNSVAGKLASSDMESFKRAVWESLALIGETVGVERIYVFENFMKDGQLYCRRVHEWLSGTDFSPDDEDELILDYREIPQLYQALSKNQIINKLVQDIPANSRGAHRSIGAVSTLLIPAFIQGKFWGSIGLNSTSERVFLDVEESVLQSGGHLIASSIIRHETMRMLLDTQHELLEQAELLKAANDAAAVILQGGQGNFRENMSKALGLIAEASGLSRIYIWKNSVENGVLCGTQVADWLNTGDEISSKLAPAKVPLDEYFPGWRERVETGRIINGPVGEQSLSLYHRKSKAKRLRSFLVLPIYIHDKWWGFIGFDDCEKERVFSDAQIEIFESSGMMIVSAIIRNEISENLLEAEELAAMDNLTKLENRRSFDAKAGLVFQAHRKNGHELAVLFLDIDHFKMVNDKFGHQFGDEVLVRFAQVIRKSIRPSDLSCRLGGEEFVVLLANTNETSAREIGRRIMGAIGRLKFQRNPGFKFTTSIGIMAGIPEETDSLADYIHKSDMALYAAKKAGRNRIEIFTQPETAPDLPKGA